MGSEQRTIGASGTREQRVLWGGVAVVAVALLLTYAILPAITTWRARSAHRESLRQRVSALQAVAQRAPTFETQAQDAENALAGHPQRLLHARSLTLAASAIESLLQDAADASQLQVNRVDVPLDVAQDVGPEVTPPASPGSALRLAAELSATGDIHGLATILSQLQRGPRPLRIERLTVQINPALLGAPDVLQMTLGVMAPVVVDP